MLTVCIGTQLVRPARANAQCSPHAPMTHGAPCADNIECGPRTTRCLCDDAGNVVLEETDRNGDGNADTRTHLTYSAEGDLVLKEVDRGLDDIVDERHRWEYEDGNLQAYEIDRDADCVIDSRTSYFTDETGVILWEENDADGDGTAEERITFAYDGGNRVGRLVDIGVNGTIERECQYDPPCPPPYAWEDCTRNLYCQEVPPPAPALPPPATRPQPDGPPDNVYRATLDELSDEFSLLRSSAHTLVLFSVDEEAAGWACEPCEVMRSYFSWRARDTLRLGIVPSHLRYVLLELDPRDLESRPAFLLDDIAGWPTIVHLISGQSTETLEDRLRGLNIHGLRDLVRSLEAEYWP